MMEKNISSQQQMNCNQIRHLSPGRTDIYSSKIQDETSLQSYLLFCPQSLFCLLLFWLSSLLSYDLQHFVVHLPLHLQNLKTLHHRLCAYQMLELGFRFMTLINQKVQLQRPNKKTIKLRMSSNIL